MAQFQSVGTPVTLAAGGTHYWDFWFGRGFDIGAAVATPNILDSWIDIRLVTSDLGTRTVQSNIEEAGPDIRYTVAVHNKGTFAVKYNLDIGTFQ